MSQHRPYLVHAWPEHRWWVVSVPDLDAFAQVQRREEIGIAASELIAEWAPRSRQNAEYTLEVLDGPPAG